MLKAPEGNLRSLLRFRPSVSGDLGRWTTFHECGAQAGGHRFTALIESLVFEFHHTGGRTRARRPQGAHDGSGADRVAVKHRLGKLDLAHAEVGDGGA